MTISDPNVLNLGRLPSSIFRQACIFEGFSFVSNPDTSLELLHSARKLEQDPNCFRWPSERFGRNLLVISKPWHVVQMDKGNYGYQVSKMETVCSLVRVRLRIAWRSVQI